MHYADFVRLYGPLSGFTCFAFERNNGTLSRVNHNGKTGSDLAAILHRAWHRESSFCAVVNNPAPNATAEEKEALRSMVANRAVIRGTLMLDEARGNAANRTIRLPRPYKPKIRVHLGKYNAYLPLLRYMEQHYSHLNFVDAAYIFDERPTLPKTHQSYRIYTHALYSGFKSVARNKRSKAASLTCPSLPGSVPRSTRDQGETSMPWRPEGWLAGRGISARSSSSLVSGYPCLVTTTSISHSRWSNSFNRGQNGPCRLKTGESQPVKPSGLPYYQVLIHLAIP
ncbi:hypothetical protein FFLO_06535 [Filobasidium floriforme]|uniref:Uncharacterized protein n=1 Tax=Filobasidium floriforme TaxID=5210 RepID=A0A8K0NQC7_9TREE|nr:hypothetical protein FFLO_06535 [Filobasidium floriforme]